MCNPSTCSERGAVILVGGLTTVVCLTLGYLGYTMSQDLNNQHKPTLVPPTPLQENLPANLIPQPTIIPHTATPAYGSSNCRSVGSAPGESSSIYEAWDALTQGPGGPENVTVTINGVQTKVRGIRTGKSSADSVLPRQWHPGDVISVCSDDGTPAPVTNGLGSIPQTPINKGVALIQSNRRVQQMSSRFA